MQPSRDPLREVITDVYRKHDSGRTRPGWEDIIRIFQDSIDTLDTVYLVVDALDECLEDTRKILLDYFRSLPANTRLLVTTRHIAEITDEFRDCPKVQIRADPVDLRKYITTRIAGNRRLEGYVLNDSSLKTHICDKVTTKADGMFLAAKLHVDSLSTKTSTRMLKKALENLSNDLNVLYNDALSRIESQNQDDRKLAKDALRWVAYTYSPLAARALREALAIEPGDTDFDNEAMPTINLVLSVCAGLIILDQETQMVRLVHYTAQDFLDKIQNSEFGNVHALIASDCITYLSYEYFQHPKAPSGHGTEGSSKESSDLREASSSTSTSPTKFAFLGYASSFWAQHAMANQHAVLSTQIHQFLAGNPRVMLEKHPNYERHLWDMPTNWLKPCHSLQIAAFFGFCDELEGFLKETRMVDATTDDLNLLHLAAHNDQGSAIRILLDHGADLERRDPDGSTPLHRAGRNGALNAATTLVNSGADVMALARTPHGSRAPKYHTPIASVQGDSPAPFLQLLLEAGAKIQTGDIFEKTPLMARLIKTDDVQTAESLFEQHSVEEPLKKPLRSKALAYASSVGATRMINMLLDYGADANSQDEFGRTALQWASLDGYVDVMNLLLSRGAHVDARDWDRNTALHCAASGDNENCLSALLSSGADVDGQGYFEETALHKAIKANNLPGVKSLLAYGANLEVQDYGGRTPLILAAEMRQEDCALAVLRNGANANTQDKFGMTALHMAVIAGSSSIMHELCKHHATIDTRTRAMFTLRYLTSSPRPLNIRFEYRRRILRNPDGGKVEIAMLTTSSLEVFSQLRYLLSRRKYALEIRLYKEGLTARDIAVLVRSLESSTQSATESNSVTLENHLLELLGVSSATEADEVLEQRIAEERKGRPKEQRLGIDEGWAEHCIKTAQGREVDKVKVEIRQLKFQVRYLEEYRASMSSADLKLSELN
ncbi:MAG: hypothetical protein Q9207_002812 [Kuettlingeria erythrocarpa]